MCNLNDDECAREKQENKKDRSVHLFGLNELNKTIGNVCGRIKSKHICNSHLTRNGLKFYMWRFFFGRVYVLKFSFS